MAVSAKSLDMENEASLNEEFSIFCKNLVTIQSKFLDDWTSTWIENDARTVKEFEMAIELCQGDIEKLRKQIAGQELRRTQMEEIGDKLKNLELFKKNLEREFTQCQKKLEEQKLKLEADTKALLTYATNYEGLEGLKSSGKFEKITTLIRSLLHEDINAFEKVTMAKKEKVTKALTFFKERLALEFKSLKGEDQIRVIFTNIDEVDKNRQFTFDTKIVDSKYIISNCNPSVKHLDTYIKDLNESNNFAKFVINVRKAFKNEIAEENDQNIPQNGIQ